MKDCKTIEGYAIRKWMEQHGFVAGNFALAVSGNDGLITDQASGSLAVRYDPANRTVETA